MQKEQIKNNKNSILLPSTTEFLINACHKRIIKRFNECVKSIKEYNKIVDTYNRKIDCYNKMLKKHYSGIKLLYEQNKSFDENHKKEFVYDIIEKNNIIDEDNKEIEKRNDNRIYGEVKEYKSRKHQYYRKNILPKDVPLISNIMNNERTDNNKYLINYSSLGSIKEKIGITYVLGFNNINEVLWGNINEIQANLPMLHLCVLGDIINYEKEIKAHIKNAKLYYYSDIAEFQFNEILCEFIPFATQNSYRSIIPSDLDKVSVKKYYGIELFNDELMEHTKIYAIQYIYTIPDYRKEFDKIVIDYMKKRLIKNKSNKKRSETIPLSDKVLLKELIEPKIIPLLMKFFQNRNSLGRRVSEIIKYDLSTSKKLIEQNNFSEEELNELKRINCLSSKYAADLSEIQKEKLDIQLLDSFLFS